jgi:glycosyltransferase involved in cell wall biosynthesis
VNRHSRIAVFLATSGHSGVDRIMKNLIRETTSRGINVDLLHVRGHGPYFHEPVEGLRVVDLGVSHVTGSLLPLIRYLRRERPVGLLSDKDRVNRVALLAKRMASVPVRLVVRIGTTVSVNLSQRSWLQRRIQYFSIGHLYRWADRVVVPSAGAADDLVQVLNLPGHLIRVLPSPIVDQEIFALASEPVDHPWLNDPAVPVILGVGELCARKDFSTLIKAFARVRALRPCRLLVLGEGRQRQHLEGLVSHLNLEGSVSLPGFAKNPFPFMQRASLLVLSSICEGLPVALVEALALGTPVVATDCPSGPREILADGHYGPLTPVGDEAGLAEAMMRTLDDPPYSTDLRSAAMDFSVDQATSRYLEILGVKAGDDGPTLKGTAR